MVPNRQSSIYTRLWCVYEAFLAQQQGKIIRTAVRIRLRRLASAALAVVLLCTLGLIVGLLAKEDVDESVTAASTLLFWLFLSFSIVLGGQRPRLLLHCAGVVLASFAQGIETDNFHHLHDIAFLLVAELDRVRLAAHKEEAANLLRDFRGSVQHATCSEVADAAAIWAEIGMEAGKVDHTIDLLLRAMQSTPLWDSLDAQGFAVRDAGFTEWSIPAHEVVAFVIHTHEIFGSPKEEWAVRIMTSVVMLLWGVMVPCFPSDRRAFRILVLQKVMTPYFFIHACMKLAEVIGASVSCHSFSIHARLVVSCIVLVLSAIPPLSLSRIPVVGPCSIHFVLRRIRLHRGRLLGLARTARK